MKSKYIILCTWFIIFYFRGNVFAQREISKGNFAVSGLNENEVIPDPFADLSKIIPVTVPVPANTSFIPNAFTPNSDNLNDVFMPLTREIHDYRLLIYNRWGQKIFESNMPQIGWDGNYNNNVCEEGVYVFKVHFTNNSDGKYYQYDGRVTLMR